MKKIVLILLMFISFGAYAQTDREILLDISKQQLEFSKQLAETNKQLAKQGEQIAELAKQQAVATTKVEGLEKSVKERLDMQSNFMLGLMGLVAALIGAIFWDRKTALRPLETSNVELTIAIALLKEKEAQLEIKLQEKQLKDEKIFKNLFEKFPDLANLA